MAKVKKTKKPKTAVVPMTFNGAVTPIGVDASWTGLAVTALGIGSVDLERGPQKPATGDLRVRMSEVLSTKPDDFPCQAARLEHLGSLFLAMVKSRWFPVEWQGPNPTPLLVAIEGYAMGSKTRPQMRVNWAGILGCCCGRRGFRTSSYLRLVSRVMSSGARRRRA